MDKKELIERLKALEESFPKELTESENAIKIMSNSNLFFQKSLEKLEEAEINENEYDVLACEREIEKRELLASELKEMETNYSKSAEYYDVLEKDIDDIEEKVISFLPKKIETYERIISDCDYQYEKAYTEEEKKFIFDKKVKRQKELELLKKERESLASELSEKKEKLFEIREALSSKKESIENYKNDIKDINYNIEEIKKSGLIDKNEKEKLELDTEALYRMSRFFSANPKEEINNIIIKLEENKLNETEIKEKLQNLKVLLTSGIYNIEGLKTKLTREQVLEKRNDIEEDIKSLEEKLSEDGWYMKKTSQYSQSVDNIIAYKEIINNINNDKANSLVEKEKDEQEIDETNTKISRCNEWIKEGKVQIEKIGKSHISNDEKSRRIENINLKIDSYENMKEIFVNKVKRLENKKTDYERSEYISNLRISKYKTKIEEEREKLYKFDESEKERDKHILEELEAQLLSTYMINSVFENDYIKQLDGLITLTGGSKTEKETIIPSFAANFTPEQMEMYQKILSGISPEEIKEVEETLNEKFKEIPENLALSPIQKEKMIFPDGEKVKVKKFKTLAKEKIDKVKEFFKNNWKAITKKAIIIATCIGMIATVTCSTKNNKNESVVRHTNPMFSPLPIPTQELDDEIVLPEETPEVTPPEFESEKPSKPTNPEMPDIPETPNIPDIPVINPEVPVEDTVDTYTLTTEFPEGTGNSAPADPNEAHLTGESVYDPSTNTWVDSQGTKITQNEDGTFSIEHNAEEVTAIDENTNQITDPDTSPIENPSQEETLPVEPPIDYEEAVESGVIDEEEAQEYQDFFDEMFGSMEEEPGQGIGGR